MIHHLRIENFKAWRDTGAIRLAPITVLFGGNSAGKTSIPQLLLMLKQTAESPDRHQVLHLGDNRSLLDLGTYEDIVHKHDVSQPLAFELTWAPQEPLRIHDPLSGHDWESELVGFGASIQADRSKQPQVRAFNYGLHNARFGYRVDVGVKVQGTGKYDLVTAGYDAVRQPGRAWPLPPPERFYGFPNEAIAYYQNTRFVSDFVLTFERLLRDIYYVGPLREHPKRLYLWSGEKPLHVGERGERAVEAILGAGERGFNFTSKQRKKTLAVIVAERLRKMGLIHDFSVELLAPGRKEYEVKVKVGALSSPVRLTDVGFGVSQVLPVIVESFYVPRDSVVIMEQPELHLHPRAQAELADLFIDAIRAREDGLERNTQFIIESHSEHFLHRLRRRIAEQAISEEDVAIYFVDQPRGEARLSELKVDLFGNILNWPQDFFGNPMEDMVAQAEAQARRMEVK